MSQDTRKDPRAKVLTMTVRYKSATVDEFIEHHSYDVSRGGIFIKTPSPFPPGTLLKFEIKIADDKSVLQGVGRVVWKREAAQGTTDNPAGMGVKFIKIDDASKATIDRLVSTQSGPTAYDAEAPAEKEEKPAAPAPAPAPTPAQMVAGFQRKGTMMGLGAVAKAVSEATPAPAAASSDSGGGGFFPSTPISEAEMPPPAERTVMKQAAELLQEALKEAGGSLAEISDNPLFEQKPSDFKPEPAKVERVEKKDEPAVVPVPVIAEPKVDSPKPAAVKAEEPAPVSAAPPPRASDPPKRGKSLPPPEAEPPPADKGGGRTLLIVGALAVAAVGAYLFTQSGPPPAPPAPTPATTSAAATTSAPAVTASETAAPSASAAPTVSAAPSSSAAVPAASASGNAKPSSTDTPGTKPTTDTTKTAAPAKTEAPPAKTVETPPAKTLETPPAKTETPPAKTETPKPPPAKTEAPPKPKPGGDDNPY